MGKGIWLWISIQVLENHRFPYDLQSRKLFIHKTVVLSLFNIPVKVISKQAATCFSFPHLKHTVYSIHGSTITGWLPSPYSWSDHLQYNFLSIDSPVFILFLIGRVIVGFWISTHTFSSDHSIWLTKRHLANTATANLNYHNFWGYFWTHIF